jgi:hypothetical protein
VLNQAALVRRLIFIPTRNAHERFFFVGIDPPQLRGGYFTIINLKDNSYGRSQTGLRTIFGAAFCGSSDWRRCQSAKFPNDPRNPKAQRRLLELEAEIAIPDASWEKLSPHYNEFDSHWLAAVSDTNRDVGFRRHSTAQRETYNKLDRTSF